MIIYNKDYNLIGIDANILTLLGYEDISAFKTFNNDIADLFIKKPGYIHKFDNFSWISYILSGGAPNKDVLIKLRNEKVAQATISIKEISLIENDEKMFIVDLENFKISDDPEFATNNEVKKGIFELQENSYKEEDFSDLKVEDDTKKTTVFDLSGGDDTLPIMKHATEAVSFDTSNGVLGTNISDESSYDFETEDDEEAMLIKKIFIDDEEPENIFNSSDNSDDNLLSTQTNDYSSDFTLPKDSIDETKDALNDLYDSSSDDVSFTTNSNDFEIKKGEDDDFEPLDIDENDICQYIKEYCEYLTISIDQLRELNANEDNANTDDLTIKLISIGHILQTNDVTHNLNRFYDSKDALEKKEILDDLEISIKNLTTSLK